MLRTNVVRLSLTTPVAIALVGGAVIAAPAAIAESGTHSQTSSISVLDRYRYSSDASAMTISDAGSFVPIPGTGSDFPSTVTVSPELAGTITDVDVYIDGLSHSDVQDLDVMLVGPTGQRVMLFTDVAAGGATSAGFWVDDEATEGFPTPGPVVSGNDYRPSGDGEDDWFLDPAPASQGAATSLAALDGTNPRGTWNLYVEDDTHSGGVLGSLDSWSLYIETSNGTSPYPSELSVSGRTTPVTDVNLSLNGLTHTWPADLDVVLQAPSGQAAMVMSDVGGGTPITATELVLDDEAGSVMSQDTALNSGTYRPTDQDLGGPDDIPAPGPEASTLTASLSIFDGVNPNGTWKLFVTDDGMNDVGSLSGWSLQITTVDRPAAPTITGPTNDRYQTYDMVWLGGGAPGGHTVRVYDGSALLTTVTASATGAWSARLTGVAPVAHTYTATALDSYGNESVGSNPVTVTVDPTRPIGGLRVNANAARTNTSNVSLTISASDIGGSGVASMRFSNDHTTWTELEPYATTKAWTLTPGDGARTVYVQFADMAGNVSTSSDSILVDSLKPQVSRTKPAHQAVGVRVGAGLRAFFSEAIAKETLTSATVKVTKKGSTKAVKATLSYDQIKRKLVINPAKPLRARTTYKILIRTGVTDLAGNPLDQKPRTGLQPLRWSITTG